MHQPPMQTPPQARAPRIEQVPQPPDAPGLPGATPGGLVPAQDIVGLQAQLNELRVQQIGLKAQWNGLERQLQAMRETNPARPGVAKEWADVGSQLAQVDANIAVISARLSQRQGGRIAGTTIPGGPPMGSRANNPDPEMIIGMAFALLMVIALPMSIAFARRVWRGKPVPPGPRVDEIAPRLDRLEQAVDAIAIEVERISEGQRFVTKILADRPAAGASSVDGNPLALGAGAAEPVRVGEREAVKHTNR